MHHFEDAFKVTALHGEKFREGFSSLLLGLGEDHLAHGADAVRAEEHVLGTGQTDALCAEVQSLLGVLGGVRIGVDAQLANLIRPAHESAEVAADGGGNGLDGLAIDVAGGAVQGDVVPLVDGLAAQLEQLFILVDDNVAAAGHTAGAHAPSNHRRVGGHAAPGSQNTLGYMHAFNVLRGGLQADQNHRVPGLLDHLHRVGSGEGHTAAGGAGRGGQSGADGFSRFQGGGVKLGMEQGVQGFGVYHKDGLFLGDHPFIHQVAGDLQGGGGGALAVPGLEHIKLAPLDGELHVLHVVVVFFQFFRDSGKLFIHLGHDVPQLVDGLGGADAGDHVLALGVHQEFAVQFFLTGGGVAGESHAGAGGVAHIAVSHGLDIDCGAPRGGDVVHPAVVDGARVIPGAEDRFDGAHQLLSGVGGEVFLHHLFVSSFEEGDQLFHIGGSQLGVVLDAPFFLHLVDDPLKVGFGKLADHVGIHLDKPAVGIVGEPLVLGQGREALHHFIVEAQVEDGVHHAGHGSAGAGADRHHEGVFLGAKGFAGHLLQGFEVCKDLRFNFGGNGLAILIIAGAGLGGNGKALGNRHAQVGHLRQVGAFAAQQFPHFAVAFGKQENVFCTHH